MLGDRLLGSLNSLPEPRWPDFVVLDVRGLKSAHKVSILNFSAWLHHTSQSGASGGLQMVSRSLP